MIKTYHWSRDWVFVPNLDLWCGPEWQMISLNSLELQPAHSIPEESVAVGLQVYGWYVWWRVIWRTMGSRRAPLQVFIWFWKEWRQVKLSWLCIAPHTAGSNWADFFASFATRMESKIAKGGCGEFCQPLSLRIWQGALQLFPGILHHYRVVQLSISFFNMWSAVISMYVAYDM